MDDVASLTSTDLHARLDAAIHCRVDAVTPADRARAGDELLLLLREFVRRGMSPVRRGRCAAGAAGPPPGSGTTTPARTLAGPVGRRHAP